MAMLIDSNLSRTFDRLPPHSIDVEKALIGSLMRLGDDRVRWAKVLSIVTGESFFQSDHAEIFKIMGTMHAAGDVVEPIALRAALESHQLLAECGGAEYLAELYTTVPHGVQAVQYAETIRTLAMRRAIISVASDALRQAYGPTDGAEDTAEAMAMALAAKATKIAVTGKPDEIYNLGDVAEELYWERESGEANWIATGLSSLDQLIHGLRPGGKVILGARPAMGKSLLLKQILLNVAGRRLKCGIVSVEESRFKIAENAVANVAGIINNRVSSGRLEDGERQAFARGVNTLKNITIKVIDSARKLSSIVAAVHRLRLEFGCDVIGIDHLHLIDGQTDEHREREISKISSELKWAYKDLGVAGIECAQLNRASGKDRPSLASLRDSGSLEQDADVVILLHREDYYRTSGFDNTMELIVAKNKNGAPGLVHVCYDGARQRVRDLDPFGGAQ